MKLLAEKAITSSDYKIYILLLNMSKAFDTVNRNQLFETLEEIILPDEIHLLHILTNDVKLKVRVGADYGPEFTTSVGIMQGDCLSAVLFILYLAKALSSRPPLETAHCYSRPPQLARDAPTQLLDHTYAENPDVATLQPFNMRHSFTVRAKYAYDITYASTSKDEINLTKVTVPGQLHAYNLHVNEHTNEEYTVPDATTIRGKDSWRKCKLLGSLLDTKEDIQRRKMITISTMQENSHVCNSKYLTLSQKIRHFRVFAECIFLYNCELWTTTTTINDSIYSFHRRQLRYALGIKYPRVITNQQLYDVTKCEPCSIVTERRRLSWLGHMMRLNPETPARQSFKEALRPVKRKPGRHPMTWITTIQQDLSKRDIHINLRDISAIEKLESMCHDRVGWKARCSMREPRETSPLSSVSAQHVTSECS